MATEQGAQNAGQSYSARKLRILMLHGYTQSGELFEIKTKALKKGLEKHFPSAPKPGHLPQYPGGIELVYPTAPLRLHPNDVPGHDVGGPSDELEAYGWWKRKGDSEPFIYEGMEFGLSAVATVLKDQGPFDGALGFSQGGALAGMVASLLEPGRRESFERHRAGGGMPYPESFTPDSNSSEHIVHPTMKFAVSYSGFGASTHPLYEAFYEPKIETPMCHFIGSVDTVVSEERSLRLVDACKGGRGTENGVARVVYHPGGHFLPSSQKPYVAALVMFIREAIENYDKSNEVHGAGNRTNTSRGVGDEKAEDMDFPF